MLKIDAFWEDHRSQLVDQAAPLLQDLREVLGGFHDPELGYFGAASLYARLSSRALVLEQPMIERLLEAAKKNGFVLSIDTRNGPLVVTFMKQDVHP